MLTWHAKAGNSLATLAGAGPDVHHARLLALGTVRGLLLTPVCKVGLGPSTEALAGGGPHINHIICLAPVIRSSKEGFSKATVTISQICACRCSCFQKKSQLS